MSITYTLRRRDSRGFTTSGAGVSFTVAVGPRGADGAAGAPGPNLVSDATTLGALTDDVADALFLLASNAAGTAVRKAAITTVVRAILQATTTAGARTAIGAEASGTASASVASHVALADPHPQYALESALGTVSTLSYPGGTSLYLRADGTWAAVSGGGSSAWGGITGTLSSQTDLQTALDAKAGLTASNTLTGANRFTQGIDLDVVSSATHGLTVRSTGNGKALRVMNSTLSAEYFSISSVGQITIPANGYIGFAHSSSVGDPNYIISGGGAGLGVSTTGGFFVATGGTVRKFSVATGGEATFVGHVTVGTYTVGTLPSASASAGALAQVTDASSTTNGTVVASGGATRVPVFSNGTNWIVK